MTESALAVVEQVRAAERAAPKLGIERLEIASDSLQIYSEEDHRAAGEMLRSTVTLHKQWSSYWTPVIAAVKSVYDMLREKRDGGLTRTEAVRTLLERKMAKWRAEQEAAHAQSAMLATQRLGEMRTRLEADAKKALKAGKIEDAESIRSQITLLPDAAAPPAPDFALSHVAQVKMYEFTVTDPALLARAVGDGTIPLAAVKIELRVAVAREYRKSLGQGFSWPGVEVKETISYRPQTFE